MNFEEIKSRLLQIFGFEPTTDQELALDDASRLDGRSDRKVG